MPRTKRKQSEGDVYHVIIRGVGRQILFEDEWDRQHFLKYMQDSTDVYPVEIYAWCLMDNHVHLLVHATLPDLSIFMNRVESAYAIYFNKRHDRVGTLFQGRYSSVPINDDPQLMLAVRYIHHNPVKKGEPLENKWSSYTEYTTTAAICNTGFVESIFGGRKQFIAFHQKDGEPYSGIPRCRMSESQAEEIAHSVLDGINPYDVRGLPKERRDAILREMRMRGLSIRQIERITSVGRNIIAKVK